MKKALALLLVAVIAFSSLASASVIETTSGNAVVISSGSPISSTTTASYVGPVATATMIPSGANANAGWTMMTRKAHYNRSRSTRFSFAYPNWRASTLGETPTGNSITIQAWVEYPVGTYNQILFTGSNSATIADMTTVWSDYLTVSIPKDALFYEWVHVSPTTGNGYPYFVSGSSNVIPMFLDYKTGFEFAQNGASNIFTAPAAFGTICPGYGCLRNVGYWSAAIRGDTTAPTFCLVGDSRTIGSYELSDRTLDFGNLARAIGPTHAYLNLAVNGSTMSSFIWGGNLRRELISTSGCTNILSELGVNEVYARNGSSDAWTAIHKLYTYKFNGTKFARTTMEPISTSTDLWATVAGQTSSTAGNNITTANGWIRSSVDGVPYADLSDAVSSARDSGLWKANGYPKGYVPDGVHINTKGSLLIQNSGVINPNTLASQSPISVSYPSLTMTGSTPTYEAGKFSNAAVLTAGKNIVNLGYVPGVYPMTYEGWIKTSSSGASAIPVMGLMVGTTNGVMLKIAATTGYAALLAGNGSYTTSTAVINDGVWHHIEVVLAQASPTANVYIYLFIDGSLGANFPVNFAPNQSYIYDVSGFGAGSTTFAGTIDEMAMWNIAKHTDTFTPPVAEYVGDESGLIGVWHMNDNLDGVRGPAGQ